MTIPIAYNNKYVDSPHRHNIIKTPLFSSSSSLTSHVLLDINFYDNLQENFPFPTYIFHILISFTNLNAQFFYSLTICMLHYNPRHVSSINMPIFRRTNFIITASGIISLCTVQFAGWEQTALQSALIQHTVQPFTESDDTRCYDNTIFPPEDGHVNARNMSRIVV